jgi:ketosteroid isomerase-like protein
VEPVRQSISTTARSRRRGYQHLQVRFPRATAALARAGYRPFMLLPARSRLRKAVVRTFVQHGFEATNRRDLEAAFSLYAPDVESIWPPELAVLGFELTRGREARTQAQLRWLAEWGDLWFDLEELIDLGDRVVTVTRMKGSGLASGADAETDCVFIYTLGPGGAVREQFFLDRREAFAAVGLTE